jgi:hypothetical protein
VDIVEHIASLASRRILYVAYDASHTTHISLSKPK